MEVNRNQNGLVTNIQNIFYVKKKKNQLELFSFWGEFPFRSAKNPQITVEVLIKLDKTFNKYLRSSFIK